MAKLADYFNVDRAVQPVLGEEVDLVGVALRHARPELAPGLRQPRLENLYRRLDGSVHRRFLPVCTRFVVVSFVLGMVSIAKYTLLVKYSLL